MGVMAGASRRTAGRVLALGGAGSACGVVAAGLAARAGQLVGRPVPRADEVVELGVVAAGALVLAWLTASALLAATCLAVRAAGRTWRRGESWVHRFAPAAVRRALVVVVAAGLGAGGAGAASAAEPPTTSPTAVATANAGDAALDLGWIVTSPAAPQAAAVTATPTPTEAVPDGPSAVPATAAPAPATSAPAPSVSVPAPSSAIPAPGPSSVSPAPAPVSPSTTAAPPPASTPTPSAAVRTPAGSSTWTPAVSAWAPAVAAEPTPSSTAPASTLSPPATSAGAGTTAPETATVTVAAGDTLWAIAARHLPAGATDAQIAAAWPAWYAANVAVVGPDPDLILPGQVLVVPAAFAVAAGAAR